jgi:hypothetical protein
MAAMSYDAVHSDPTETNDELRTDAGPRQLSEVRIRYLRDEYGGSEQSVLAPAAEELRPHHRCCALILLLAICAAVGYWWLVQVYWWLVLPREVPVRTVPLSMLEEVDLWLSAHGALLPGLNVSGVCDVSEHSPPTSTESSTQSVDGRRSRHLSTHAINGADGEHQHRQEEEDQQQQQQQQQQSALSGDARRANDVHDGEMHARSPSRRRLGWQSPDAQWAWATATARGLVSNMTFEEKASLVRGVGWSEWSFEEGYYVGSVPAVPRLRIPSINMHDGPQGFRTTDRRIVGSVTSWPCLVRAG